MMLKQCRLVQFWGCLLVANQNQEETTHVTASADVCNTQGNMPGGWNEFDATLMHKRLWPLS